MFVRFAKLVADVRGDARLDAPRPERDQDESDRQDRFLPKSDPGPEYP